MKYPELPRWQTLQRKTVLQHSKFLRLEQHRIRLPDGQIIEDWPWIVTPDFVNVVLRTEQGQFVCFHQTKYAIAHSSLAPVGGYIDEGETPLQAAKREVLEETGYQAAHWQSLGQYAVDGNRGAGTAHLFLAQGAKKVAEIVADDLEEQQLLLLSRVELEQALDQGQFALLPWTAVFALALRHLQAQEKAP